MTSSPTTRRSPSPPPRRTLRLVLGVLVLLATCTVAVVLLAPYLVEGLARREIGRLSARLAGTFEVDGVVLQGSTAVTLRRVAWRDGSDWEATAEGVRVEVDPFGFLVGGRKIERVAIERVTARLGTPAAPLEGPDAVFQRLRGLLSRGRTGSPDAGGRDAGFRTARLPDLAVAHLAGVAYVDRRVLQVTAGHGELAPVKDESVQVRRRLVAEFTLDPGDGTMRRLEAEAILGTGSVEKASARVSPPVVLPGPWGSLSIEGAAWAPGEVAVLGPAVSKPDYWTVRAEHVAVRWDEGEDHAPQVLLDRLPPDAAATARRLLAGRTIRAVDVLRPSIDVVLAEPPPMPRPPAARASDGPAPTAARIVAGAADWAGTSSVIRAPSKKSAVRRPEPEASRVPALPAAPAAAQVRLVQAFQESTGRLTSLTEALSVAAGALPRAKLEVHGASVRTLEPGQTAPRPGQSLVNLEARIERTAAGPVEASLRFECPEAPADANEALVSFDPASGDLRVTVKAAYLPLYPFRAVLPRWLRTREAVLRQADGTLHLAPGSRRADGTGTIRIEGLVLDLPSVASAPLQMAEAQVTGSLAFDWAAGSLDVEDGRTVLGRIRIPFALHAGGLADRPRFALKGSVERLPAQEVVDSLPKAVLASLEGMRLSGTFAATFDVDVDTGNLDAVRLDVRPDVADVTTVSLGKAVDLDLLQSVFLHRIEEGDGTIVDRLIGEATPEWVPLAEVPRFLVDALTTSEDASFFKHKGFSTVGIRRSVKVNLERGGFYQGASTLSQQLVKNLFLSREKTLSRKLQEVFLTWQMEQSFPKEKILELYLNVIEWGPNIWGLREAAGHYFAKRPFELTLLEAAYLVTIIPSPRSFHKHIEEGAVPTSFERRVKFLLEEMERRKLIGGEDVAAALEQHVRFAAVQPPATEGRDENEPPDEEYGGE